MRCILTLFAATGLCMIGFSSQGKAQSAGVSDHEITIGMTTVLSGPSHNLGDEMKRGVEAYFATVNEQGGIHGRKLRLDALDDGYEPARAAPNMRQLIDDKQVFAILGNVGTPTAVVSVPIAMEKKVPFFGALTGAGILRKNPPDRYVINFRASYAEETAAMVKGLVHDLGIKPEHIAFFTQNDAYGDAGYQASVKALHDIGFTRTAAMVHGRYQRNTVNVEDGLTRILDAKRQPKAIIMVGTYKACAKFIKLAKSEGLNALFLNVSFVGSESLMAELGPQGQGVIVTQVVPPLDSNMAVIEEYKKAIKPAKPSFISLEGYLAARSFAEGLRRAGRDLTREKFIDVLEASTDIDIGLGEKHSLSPTQHQISHAVWPTMITGNQFRSFRWSDIRKPGS
ncbi:MAG TPA: ABC transporter substrate-binding protein [Oligoflexus sp.]|uniref:ABC transporter substrate-binding protein n=1 Tax=Oligoflexus sp. TaxID=1971216 RepID=UPI002D51638A|nr:ABC transporter substrate-binding protein [Oligoflexus sp.]HYX34757.1 ABC transporter substrate-binding protein [Oligoflexus sp.]